MDPTVERHLDDLRAKRQEVEKRLRDREQKKKESDEMFVASVKKELEWLEKNKIKYELRNKKFLEEAKEIVEDYKAELAKAYQADQALNASRRKLNKFIQKNYPKIVSELKTRLFRDHDDVSKKLKSMRDGGDMIRLNKEIRDLSDEIQAKRYELLEEEERRLRHEGSLKYYQYTANPYSRPYDAVPTYGKRNVSPPANDLSRSKGDISISPQKAIPSLGARGTGHYDDLQRPSTLSKASQPKYGGSGEKDHLHANKGVSFGRGSEVPKSKETDSQGRLSYDNKSTGINLKLNEPKKSPKRIEDEWEDHDRLHHHHDDHLKSGTTPGFGKGAPASGGFGGASGFGTGGAASGFGTGSSSGGLKLPASGGSPGKSSGFGQPAATGGMQKLNLSNVNAQKQQSPQAHKHQHQHNYYGNDMDDLDDDFDM